MMIKYKIKCKLIFCCLSYISQDPYINYKTTRVITHNSMSYPAYRVKLTPTNDAHVEYLNWVKMLTEDEANAFREMIKDQIGKTVGKVGVGGEEYEIFSSCPNINMIHAFWDGIKSKSVSYGTYYHEKYSKKANPTPTSTTYQCSPAMATCDGLSPVNHMEK